MKQIYFCLLALSAICLSACSNDTEKEKPTSALNNELILKGKEFAKIHNECLDDIYKTLITAKTRRTFNTVSLSDIVMAANQYIGKRNE